MTARLIIGACASGSGKTAVTCALLGAFSAKGLTVRAAKCGPDYIDPMFHREVLGVESVNFDLFFSTPNQLRGQLERHGSRADITLIEGVMGYYDGRSMDSTRGSTYEIAAQTETAVVLVIDARGGALTVAALAEGMARFRDDSRIAGIILNRISEGVYTRLKPALEQEFASRKLRIEICGYIPNSPEFSIESRHLGLITPDAAEGIRQQLSAAADIAGRTIDIEALLCLASARHFPVKDRDTGTVAPVVRLAVARDEAFCFYYAENLRQLRRFGCEIVYFSPLRDDHLPEGTDGLLLGGGYPELYAHQLSGNVRLREQIRDMLDQGMPCLAECGGFMYLNDRIADDAGVDYPMAGFFHGVCRKASARTRFGYISIKSRTEDGLYLAPGESIRAHEFHYWDCSDPGAVCRAAKPDGREWLCGHVKENTFAGFAHLAYWSCPSFAERFARRCAKWGKERMRGAETTPDKREQGQNEQDKTDQDQTEKNIKKRQAWQNRRQSMWKGSALRVYDKRAQERAQTCWNQIAKPLHGLGKLEDAITRMAGIYGNEHFAFPKKALIIMCGDNGIVEEGVTQTGQDVTAIVAGNFLTDQTSVCKMAKQAGVHVHPVDIGIARFVPGLTRKQWKVSEGTKNFMHGRAMTRAQAERAIGVGIACARRLYEEGYRLFALGEMGIGNTTTAAACAASLLRLNADDAVGRGAGLSDAGLKRKREVVRAALIRHAPDPDDPIDVLSKVGGLDISGLAGVCIGAAQCGVPVVLDGAITAVAALCAARLVPGTVQFMLASHQSREPVSAHILRELGLHPQLDCQLCLGEGSGAILLIPLLEMAYRVYTDMATFSDIQVDTYEDYGREDGSGV